MDAEWQRNLRFFDSDVPPKLAAPINSLRDFFVGRDEFKVEYISYIPTLLSRLDMDDKLVYPFNEFARDEVTLFNK